MRVVVGSVIYDSAMVYLDEFLNSLEHQTFTNYDIVLLNDNICRNKLSGVLKKYSKDFIDKIQIIDLTDKEYSPFRLRVELMQTIKRMEYDLFVWLDSDDICSDDRIEKITQQYDERYTFFYNELRQIHTLEHVMPPLPRETVSIEQIMENNYLGLSNVALNINAISKEFIYSLLRDDNTLIFDWYLFSRILISGGKGKKINHTYTFYRIYNGNVAGICNNDKASLVRECKIKLEHYEILKKYDKRFEYLKTKYEDINLDDIKIEKKRFSYWWGQIKLG